MQRRKRNIFVGNPLVRAAFAFDFLASPSPIKGGGTTTTTIDADGTFVNSSGQITPDTVNVWPLDYSLSTLQPIGRAVWEGRTNLLIQSIFPGGGAAPTGWTRPGGTGTSAPAASIYGNNDGAVAYAQTATAQRPFLEQTTPSLSTSTSYTGSVYIESLSGTLTAGAVFSCVSIPAGATQSWPICEANPSGGSGGTITTGLLTLQLDIAATAGTAAVRVGLGVGAGATGSLQFSRPQFEAGSFATPRVPTGAAAVARAKDQASIANPSSLNQSAGTYVLEARTGPGNATEYFLSVDDSTANERIAVFRNSSNEIHVLVVDGGVTQADLNLGTVADNTTFKIAFAYSANDFAGSLNGAAVVTDGSGTLPTTTTHNLGQDHAAANQANGWLRKLYNYPVRLDNSRLQAFSQ